MSEEIWKSIKGYEGLYEISSYGRVKSLERFVYGNGNGKYKIFEKILKPRIRSKYYSVSLSKNSIKKKCCVHRLVAINFIDNSLNKPEVNHINGNKLDNRVENLEWVTAKENQQHASRTGLKPKGSNCFNSIFSESIFLFSVLFSITFFIFSL